MRSLQLCLHQSWDRVDQLTPVTWSPECLRDLQWWLHLPRLSQGVSFRQVSPDLDFWSDASDVGWGVHPGPLVASGIWDELESRLPVNARELLAVRRGLLHFQLSLLGKTVDVFCGVSLQSRGHQVSLSQLHRSGDPALVGVARHLSGSAVHPGLPQRPSGLSFSSSSAPAYRVVPQHDGFSIFASSVASSGEFVCHLSKSPMFDLFFSVPRPSVGRHGCLSPILGRSSGVCISSVFHHSPGSSQAPGVLGDGAYTSGSVLASAALVSGPPPAVAGPSCGPPRPSRPPAPASVSSTLPGSPQAASSCLETLWRFRASGFSSAVASQASLARRPSSRANYQLKWSVYRSWCRSHGHSISRPTLSKVAEFLGWLKSSRGLSLSSIMGYRSMLSAVFRFHLPTFVLPSCPP